MGFMAVDVQKGEQYTKENNTGGTVVWEMALGHELVQGNLRVCREDSGGTWTTETAQK